MVLNETMHKKTSKYLIFLQNTLTLPQRNAIMDIEALTQEAVGLLERMVSLPSVSREEKEVADLLENFMKNGAKRLTVQDITFGASRRFTGPGAPPCC